MKTWLENKLQELQKLSAYRSRTALHSPQGKFIRINGRQYLSFSSNDYLGLANDPRVIDALQEGVRLYGAGAGASPLVSGYFEAHAHLEEALARFLGCERVVLFSSGYMANVGLHTTLFNRDWHVFADRLNHASLIDATRFSGANLQRYKNLDMAQLRQALSKSNQAHRAIVSDAVFSMDGSQAPIDQLITIGQQFGCELLLDDAHGIGVLGGHGRGTLEAFHQQASDCTALTGTLGKAFGTGGAFVATSQALAEYMIQKSRTLIYSTASPPALAYASLTSLNIIQTEPHRREQLSTNIHYFRRLALQANLTITNSSTPIQSIIIGGNAETIKAAQTLQRGGIYVVAIRPPTVPTNTARLRITLCAHHNEEDIDRLIDTLVTTGRNTPHDYK